MNSDENNDKINIESMYDIFHTLRTESYFECIRLALNLRDKKKFNELIKEIKEKHDTLIKIINLNHNIEAYENRDKQSKERWQMNFDLPNDIEARMISDIVISKLEDPDLMFTTYAEKKEFIDDIVYKTLVTYKKILSEYMRY